MTSRTELIEKFERRIGHQLPVDYREFLMDGPFPVWKGDCNPENQATYILFSLWDVGRGDYSDLSAIWEERDPDLPDWFLEIAEIYDGVKLGVGLYGDHAGRVYSFTWDTGEPELHSETFKIFLDGLYSDGGSFDERPK
ncbi:hypothetical protein FHS27_006543 [Rhodopirellula rubra]|uniref:Knr4/Smi1-like domain-containing protein n=1 Tax=Aporhodopirellula rubra TaxID=980271 RepID=A0A7W5E5Q7_9BACT|nr:SMI1/KNR4 family protein [Aporhodopirellula rubra]MBB3210695.1 hypothetical protein [Aporhodopirellula rubra]